MKRLLTVGAVVSLTLFVLSISPANAATVAPPGITASVNASKSAGNALAGGSCYNYNVLGTNNTLLTAVSIVLVAENADGSNQRVIDIKNYSNPNGLGSAVFGPGINFSMFIGNTNGVAYPTASLPSGSRIAAALSCGYLWHSPTGDRTGVVQASSAQVTL